MASTYGSATDGEGETMGTEQVEDSRLDALDAWWRAANYLSVGQIYLLDNPLLHAAARARGRQAAAARALGHHAGAELHLDPPEPDHPSSGTSTRSSWPVRDTAARPRSPTPSWTAPTPRSTRASPDDERGLDGCSGSSLSPAGSPATSRRRRRARSTRAANSGTCCRTPTAPRSTTPTWWSPPSSATASSRPVRSPPPGTPTSSSTRCDDGAVLPILHLNGWKIANPTIPARIRRDELESAADRLRARGVHRRGRRPEGRARRAGRDDGPCSRPDPGHPDGRTRATADGERRPWPMILLVTPKGWTGPTRSTAPCSTRAPGGPIRCR